MSRPIPSDLRLPPPNPALRAQLGDASKAFGEAITRQPAVRVDSGLIDRIIELVERLQSDSQSPVTSETPTRSRWRVRRRRVDSQPDVRSKQQPDLSVEQEETLTALWATEREVVAKALADISIAGFSVTAGAAASFLRAVSDVEAFALIDPSLAMTFGIEREAVAIAAMLDIAGQQKTTTTYTLPNGLPAETIYELSQAVIAARVDSPKARLIRVAGALKKAIGLQEPVVETTSVSEASAILVAAKTAECAERLTELRDQLIRYYAESTARLRSHRDVSEKAMDAWIEFLVCLDRDRDNGLDKWRPDTVDALNSAVSILGLKDSYVQTGLSGLGGADLPHSQ